MSNAMAGAILCGFIEMLQMSVLVFWKFAKKNLLPRKHPILSKYQKN